MSFYNRHTESSAASFGALYGALIGALFFTTWGWLGLGPFAFVCLCRAGVNLWLGAKQEAVRETATKAGE